jgi:hypothetical protein
MPNSLAEKRGRGRPPLPPADRLHRVQVFLTIENQEALRKLGNGNLSAGIRKLLDKTPSK